MWKNKVNGIKVYTSITEEELRNLIELSSQHNLPVTGHLGSITAANAIDMGIHGLEHGIIGMPEFFEYGFSPESIACQDTEFDLSDPVIESLIQKIVKNRIYITPTIVTLKVMMNGFEPITEWQQYISDNVLESVTKFERMISSNKNIQNCISNIIPKQNVLLKEINNRGGLIVTGTDPVGPMITPGYGLHREMELLVEAGLSPMEVIQAATLNAAIALRKKTEFGSLEAGKRANILVVQGDPSQNINDVGNTVMIFKHGKQFDPNQLRESAVGRIGEVSNN